ncbi:cysteine desulfurase / selenocysteine lyase [Peptoniphilus asaccharolyticus DSM 20463]|uniref:Cysteine desulfurase n=1 Tax=Peptoniphilus asaccharolyticus DSM 20463 TaxID=573058 RepID=A0A1W1UP32_PEPAS|nr:SufS family cysteine desulfurase [Peptoniphilus asaccharolyticus]MBL7574984.1 SufS family cysteine desulfurase [Peptoniphilus asaccharolyticus]SMB82885.1 cysteine desulfurase / selenocysteine lyase [Peptoniphilus asaccharolyticus DSM 20463]
MLTREQVEKIREDFGYLKMDKKYVYFDNGATTQKPIQVIDSLGEYYNYENGNPHRGAHHFAMASTDVYEGARDKVREFINAKSSNEIVFVRNATEGLNLIAYSWALENLKAGDEILISIMEHHSNLVTWQYVAKKTGAKLVYLYLDEEMQITDEEFESKLNENTKLLSITAASNVVGTMPSVKEFIKKAKAKSNATCVVDAAQYAPHHKVDVQELGCDFLVFSGHKMVSAMGIGVLYGRKELLNSMTPYMYGGEMIEYVYEDKSSYMPSPQRFEAGTVNVDGAKSLKTAIEYIENIGIENIYEYESELTTYCYEKMKALPFIEVYTTPVKDRSPLISFNFIGAHPHDVASILDNYGIAIRSGHHCAQPLHRKLGNNFSCRASFAFYNTFEEIDYFIEHLEDVRRMLQIES